MILHTSGFKGKCTFWVGFTAFLQTLSIFLSSQSFHLFIFFSLSLFALFFSRLRSPSVCVGSVNRCNPTCEQDPTDPSCRTCWPTWGTARTCLTCSLRPPRSPDPACPALTNTRETGRMKVPQKDRRPLSVWTLVIIRFPLRSGDPCFPAHLRDVYYGRRRSYEERPGTRGAGQHHRGQRGRESGIRCEWTVPVFPARIVHKSAFSGSTRQRKIASLQPFYPYESNSPPGPFLLYSSHNILNCFSK